MSRSTRRWATCRKPFARPWCSAIWRVLTHAEAARRLGWPVGTVKSRQARARERLRGRLIRRGLAPLSGGIAAALSTSTARAAISESLVTSTAKTAVLVARGSATAGTISALTLAWKQRVLRAMWMTRLRIAAGVIVFVGTVVTAAGLAIHAGAPAGLLPRPQASRAPGPSARPEAPRTTLDMLRAEDIPAEKRLNGQPKNVVSEIGRAHV